MHDPADAPIPTSSPDTLRAPPPRTSVRLGAFAGLLLLPGMTVGGGRG
jgi:hypothetical protein